MTHGPPRRCLISFLQRVDVKDPLIRHMVSWRSLARGRHQALSDALQRRSCFRLASITPSRKCGSKAHSIACPSFRDRTLQDGHWTSRMFSLSRCTYWILLNRFHVVCGVCTDLSNTALLVFRDEQQPKPLSPHCFVHICCAWSLRITLV